MGLGIPSIPGLRFSKDLPVSGGAIRGGARGVATPQPPFCYVWRPCAPSQVVHIYTYICIIFKIMQTFCISNLLLGDELAIEQQLISVILTCFAADVLDKAPLAAEAPHGGAQ